MGRPSHLNCETRVIRATVDVERAARTRRCTISAARHLERAMHDCHNGYPKMFEARANRALDKFEARCGGLKWQNLGRAGRRRRRR